jgi:hypothetical protein
MTLTPDQQDEFLDHLRNGLTWSAAAYAMDLTRLDVADFIAEDEHFHHRVEDAQAEAQDHVDEAIFQAAVSGSVAAARLWMNMRKTKQSTELIPFEGISDDSDDELEALARLTADD